MAFARRDDRDRGERNLSKFPAENKVYCIHTIRQCIRVGLHAAADRAPGFSPSCRLGMMKKQIVVFVHAHSTNLVEMHTSCSPLLNSPCGNFTFTIGGRLNFSEHVIYPQTHQQILPVLGDHVYRRVIVGSSGVMGIYRKQALSGNSIIGSIDKKSEVKDQKDFR